MELSAQKTSEGKSASPEKKHSPEFLIACAMINDQIPDFWPDHPQEWFIKFEAYMFLQNQDDDYKYDIAITKLKTEDAIHAISHIIMQPPKTGKYEALIKVLLNGKTFKKEKKLDKIMNQSKSSNICMPGNMNGLLRQMEMLVADMCKMLPPDENSFSPDGPWVGFQSSGWECWYHYTYGPRSTKCGDASRCNGSKCRK